MPYLEPDPVSFLEQIIYLWVIKPYADLILMDMETQPCTVQAYREQESDVADGLIKFLMPSSRMCVCVCAYVRACVCAFIYT